MPDESKSLKTQEVTYLCGRDQDVCSETLMLIHRQTLSSCTWPLRDLCEAPLTRRMGVSTSVRELLSERVLRVAAAARQRRSGGAGRGGSAKCAL
eukprot:3828273-Pleurochrysis_carterae.AAC.1